MITPTESVVIANIMNIKYVSHLIKAMFDIAALAGLPIALGSLTVNDARPKAPALGSLMLVTPMPK
jgi:hypothetical protein